MGDARSHVPQSKKLRLVQLSQCSLTMQFMYDRIVVRHAESTEIHLGRLLLTSGGWVGPFVLCD